MAVAERSIKDEILLVGQQDRAASQSPPIIDAIIVLI
jgi:hypothetical protein